MDWMREAIWLIDSIYFDTDCISSFLWVKEERLLTSLFKGKIKIPQQVYNELSYPGIPQIKARIDTLINSGEVVIEQIFTGTPEFGFYTKITTSPDKSHIVIGKGEAAAITLAFASGGIVASNNLRGIAEYVSELNLQHFTTGDILTKGYHASLITEDEGNMIWSAMLSKKRKIGATSFSDYMHTKK